MLNGGSKILTNNHGHDYSIYGSDHPLSQTFQWRERLLHNSMMWLDPVQIVSFQHASCLPPYIVILFLVTLGETKIILIKDWTPLLSFNMRYHCTRARAMICSYYQRSARPAGPKITLLFPRLYICISVYLCIRTYHVRDNNVTYIVAMRPYFSRFLLGAG